MANRSTAADVQDAAAAHSFGPRTGEEQIAAVVERLGVVVEVNLDADLNPLARGSGAVYHQPARIDYLVGWQPLKSTWVDQL